MTRKSKRELERDLDGLEAAHLHDGPRRVVIHETIVGTEAIDDGLEPGETVEKRTEVEL